MLVIVSWVSFWLDAKSVPARVSLGVTTLLTMSTQTSSINNTLPPVSYTKVKIVGVGTCCVSQSSTISPNIVLITNKMHADRSRLF